MAVIRSECMRDILCDEKYLEKKIRLNEEQIEKKFDKIIALQEDIKNKVQRFPKKNEDIIFDTQKSIFQLINELLRARYSIGYSCDLLEEIYVRGIQLFGNIGYRDIGYVNFLQFFSIGILLEVSVEKLQILVNKADQEYMDDVLFDILVDIYGIKRKIKSTSYQEGSPYKNLVEIIKLAMIDKKKASEELKDYVSKKWLKGHIGYGWVNAHKEYGYVGFWSFDAAVITKVFELDDGKLKSDNHYPYDLAHYKNEKIFDTLVSVEENMTSSENTISGAFSENEELEKIIPHQLCEVINQVVLDYQNLDDATFWDKYDLDQCWYTLDAYQNEKGNGILGKAILNILVDKHFVFQLDYKEDVEDYLGIIPNMWNGQEVKLVRFELDNDQNYFAYIPKCADIDKIYEVKIVEETY